MPRKYSGSHTGSSFLKFTPKSIDPHYLVLYLSSSYGRNQILRKQSNSIIKYLNIDDIRSIQVPIHSLVIQRLIGNKLRKAEDLKKDANKVKEKAEQLIYKKLGFLNLDEDKQYSSAFIPSHKIIDGK